VPTENLEKEEKRKISRNENNHSKMEIGSSPGFIFFLGKD
jgi:hypothetical protein